MGFAVESRGADLFAHLTSPSAFPLDRDYAAAAVALVTEADDELLNLLDAHGGKIHNVTGSALAFVVLIDRAVVAGRPSVSPSHVVVDADVTQELFRIPARGFGGSRTLTEHVKRSDMFLTGSCAFVIDAERTTEFANSAGIPLNHLPCLAVIDRGSDTVAYIANGSWDSMLTILYDASARFYREYGRDPFVALTRLMDRLGDDIAVLDEQLAKARSRAGWRWPMSATFCLDWLYTHSGDDTDLAERWAELASVRGVESGGGDEAALRV